MTWGTVMWFKLGCVSSSIPWGKLKFSRGKVCVVVYIRTVSDEERGTCEGKCLGLSPGVNP